MFYKIGPRIQLVHLWVLNTGINFIKLFWLMCNKLVRWQPWEMWHQLGLIHWNGPIKLECLFLSLFSLVSNVVRKLWLPLPNLNVACTTNETARFKSVNNCLNTNIYSSLKTFGGKSSNLYLNAVHFSTPVLIRHLWQFKTVVLMHWCLIHAVLFYLNHRYQKAKNRLLKFCYVPATSAAQNRLLFCCGCLQY